MAGQMTRKRKFVDAHGHDGFTDPQLEAVCFEKMVKFCFKMEKQFKIPVSYMHHPIWYCTSATYNIGFYEYLDHLTEVYMTLQDNYVFRQNIPSYWGTNGASQLSKDVEEIGEFFFMRYLLGKASEAMAGKKFTPSPDAVPHPRQPRTAGEVGYLLAIAVQERIETLYNDIGHITVNTIFGNNKGARRHEWIRRR